jgi:ABC-2 type transport system permease protein
VSIRLTLATMRRVATQLRRDRRTLALVAIVPPGLLSLLRYALDGERPAFERVAVPMIGLFPLITMFLITSIAMLRERTGGTLERIMSMPISKLDLLAGYALTFGLVAACQAGLTCSVAFGLLGVTTQGSPALVVVLAIVNALLGVGLGLFLSAFATTEFQAVQFMPAALLPQILLAGLFVPRSAMPRPLRIASDCLPVSYAYDSLRRVAIGATGGELWLDVAVVAGCVTLAIGLGATTLRRRTP